MKKEDFSTRLSRALTLRNIKPIELSNKSNIPKSGISQYLKGLCVPKDKNIKKIANILNVTEDWLKGYDVPMEKEINISSNNFPIPDIPMKIPIVGKIAAGLPILATQNIEGYEFAPSSQIKEGFEYFYLRVQGDSMNLKFNDGDIVLVQKQDTLENDEIGVILIDGNDATVKKYKTENNLVILEPMSTNPKNTVQIYNPQKIDIKIIGKVISYQGKV